MERQNFTVPVATRTPSAIIANATTTSAAASTADRGLGPDLGVGRPVATALASCATSYSRPSGLSLGTTKRCVRDAVTASTMTPGMPGRASASACWRRSPETSCPRHHGADVTVGLADREPRLVEHDRESRDGDVPAALGGQQVDVGRARGARWRGSVAAPPWASGSFIVISVPASPRDPGACRPGSCVHDLDACAGPRSTTRIRPGGGHGSKVPYPTLARRNFLPRRALNSPRKQLE